MKRKLLHSLCIPLALAFGYSASVNACTNITVKAKDGTVMVARSMEFGPDLSSDVMTSTEAKKFTSPAPDGSKGVSWTAKYGYVFFNFFGQPHPVDGMNEKGLSIGLLYLPGYTKYQTVPKGKDAQALSYLEIGDWILGNFSTVAEVKNNLRKVIVFAQPINFPGYKNVVFPLHLIVTDSTGKSITIEFHHGHTYVYRNPTGVLTNSPTYEWQLNNLKNYVNLSPYSPDAIKVDGISYSGTGQGAGAVGLPGDFTPPSRFVKMNFMVHSAFQVDNAAEVLNVVQHIIDDVDIPNGVVRPNKGDKGPSDRTQWTIFKDLKNHKLYFKSYTNMTLQEIDLDKINFSKGAAELKLPVASKQMTVNATSRFLKTG